MHAIIVIKPTGKLVDDRLGVRSWAEAGVVALQRSDKGLGHAIALRAFDRRRARCEANVAGEAAGVVGGAAAACARRGVGCFRLGRRGRGSGRPGDELRWHHLDERDAARARRRGGALAPPKCAGSARGAALGRYPRPACGARLLASHGAGGPRHEQSRVARWL